MLIGAVVFIYSLIRDEENSCLKLDAVPVALAALL